MAAPKDDVVLFDKSVYDQAGVLSQNCDRLAHERLKSLENSPDKAARDPRDRPPTKEVVVPEDSTETESLSLAIDLDGLSRPTVGTRERLEESEEQAAVRLEKMRGAVRTLLECVGENANREGLLNTPSRYAEALLSLTKGYQINVKDAVNNALFYEGHNEMVIMHIGYIPSSTLIGLSKLPRISEIFSRRLQIQERLTKNVADAIMELLKPQGVAVVMECSHLCMVMRGVEKTSAMTLTSCVLGCFERQSKTRNEFLRLVGVNR
ncbi:GTP cyclohydrolase 1 [Fusarium solani]|nr:GTP cyclohydrolase 1 [Fusarium solani]